MPISVHNPCSYAIYCSHNGQFDMSHFINNISYKALRTVLTRRSRDASSTLSLSLSLSLFLSPSLSRSHTRVGFLTSRFRLLAVFVGELVSIDFLSSQGYVVGCTKTSPCISAFLDIVSSWLKPRGTASGRREPLVHTRSVQSSSCRFNFVKLGVSALRNARA